MSLVYKPDCKRLPDNICRSAKMYGHCATPHVIIFAFSSNIVKPYLKKIAINTKSTGSSTGFHSVNLGWSQLYTCVSHGFLNEREYLLLQTFLTPHQSLFRDSTYLLFKERLLWSRKVSRCSRSIQCHAIPASYSNIFLDLRFNHKIWHQCKFRLGLLQIVYMKVTSPLAMYIRRQSRLIWRKYKRMFKKMCACDVNQFPQCSGPFWNLQIFLLNCW